MNKPLRYTLAVLACIACLQRYIKFYKVFLDLCVENVREFTKFVTKMCVTSQKFVTKMCKTFA